MKYAYYLTQFALLAAYVVGSALVVEAQFGKVRGSSEAEDETKQLIVMIDYQLGGEDRFASGIIFGVIQFDQSCLTDNPA
jgi:hypothetical protein